jgi:chaperonin GroES
LWRAVYLFALNEEERQGQPLAVGITDIRAIVGGARRQQTIFDGGVMSFRPLHDRVLIKPLDEDEKTAGGIIIPDTAKEKPMQGKVVAVGPGGRDENGKVTPMDLKAGDKVLYGKWAGTEVKIDGDDLVIMKESDVMGVLG